MNADHCARCLRESPRENRLHLNGPPARCGGYVATEEESSRPGPERELPSLNCSSLRIQLRCYPLQNQPKLNSSLSLCSQHVCMSFVHSATTCRAPTLSTALLSPHGAYAEQQVEYEVLASSMKKHVTGPDRGGWWMGSS